MAVIPDWLPQGLSVQKPMEKIVALLSFLSAAGSLRRFFTPLPCIEPGAAILLFQRIGGGGNCPCAGQGWEQYRRQDSDNRDNDQ